MNNDQVKTLCIKDLCQDGKYIIPIYQRNYAWTKDEIDLLITDILEAQENNKNNNYYIGSLVVAKRGDDYEVIDGQQRLTTLKLLLSYYNNYRKDIENSKNINLTFEHREESNYSLSNIENGNPGYKNNIDYGYDFILKNTKLKEKQEVFFEFLLNNVVILRTKVPEGTDLNHYFEIMNNRGEQLEKHEVLKARLMSFLPENEIKLFSLIWDACSDMNVYAIKRFPYSNDNDKSIRTSNAFFGDLVNKIPTNYNEMLEVIASVPNSNSNSNSILELLKNTPDNINKDENDNEFKDGDFNSIIDFPNFLMIAFKIFSKKDTPLNDKYLLNEFKELNRPEEIRVFIVFLLKLRLIFDRYIIKSKDEEDSWILNGLKKYQYKNKQSYYFKEVNTFGNAFNEVGTDDEESSLSQDNIKIIQLLSMFHTAFRQKTYKNWLLDILTILSESDELKSEYKLNSGEYINILENLAYQYYKDPERQKLFELGGQSIPNYIFNYLDYLLWKQGKGNDFLKNNDFRFSLSRTSVEHYIPQNKADILLKQNEKLIDNFGNLCLISPHQNSALSDYETTTKRSFYEGASKRFDCMSLKQAIMLSKENWTEKDIEEHCEDMKNLLDTEPSQNK